MAPASVAKGSTPPLCPVGRPMGSPLCDVGFFGAPCPALLLAVTWLVTPAWFPSCSAIVELAWAHTQR